MAEYQPLNNISFEGGINTSAPPLSSTSQQSLSDGTWNTLISGDNWVKPFSGFTSQGSNTGSRKMMIIGKQFGGIKDIGGTQGSGSFFEDIGRSRWGIGAGQPAIEGTNVSGFTLSTLLQVSIPSAGTYAAPVQAGLAQPSAPDIGIVVTTGTVSNSVSSKIERRRPATGARSVASPTSAVIQPSANRVRVTFPAASSGQTHWRVYFTYQGFGGTGIHYLAQYGGVSDIPEATVAAGAVDGIARSLEFNYKDGDLLPVEASYDDYAPPAATHAIRLENVLNLAGCYADSTTAPTSTNTGTAIAVSKINNYESYIPTNLLFLPEQVVDTLSRPIDDYGYVGCENSIHAIQYVGERGNELPPCTITTILPDIGVQYPHNWCHFRGRLAIYTAEGNLLVMSETGEFDTDFVAPIAKTLRTWTTANTVVNYDPYNDCLIVGNGKRIFVGSLKTREWRQIWIPDFSVTGTITAAASAKRRLYITVTNGSALTAYTFDTGSATAPCSFAPNYQNTPGGSSLVKDIYEMTLSAETGATSQIAVCLNKNLKQTVFREIIVTSGFSYVQNANPEFLSSMVGKRVILFGDDLEQIVLPGTVLFHGKVSSFSTSTRIDLTDLNGVPFAPITTLSNLLMFMGDWTEVRTFTAGAKEFPNFFPFNMVEARSYQSAVWFKASGNIGNALSANVFGSSYPSSRAL